MFNGILILLFLLRYCEANVEIKDAGIGYIEDKDMAVLFYITLENVCDKDVEIVIRMVQCCDTAKPDIDDCSTMYLIGGNMGTLYPKDVKNVTLIYPTLYLLNRKATCNIEIQHQDENSKKFIKKQIEFKTGDGTENEENDKSTCSSVDTDPSTNCSPVDCVIKYSGEQSYFDPNTNECGYVPSCCYDPMKSMPDNGYSITNNSCIDLNCSVTTYDLHLLENNQAYIAESVSLLPNNIICHHGDVTEDGTCQCWTAWITTTNDNEVYEPTLLQYHMCNIERGSWNSINKSKIKTTGLIITIFCLTVISKLLILLCVLNFCYKHYRATHKCTCMEDGEEGYDEFIMCEDGPCDECVCGELFDNTIGTQKPGYYDELGSGYMGREPSRRSVRNEPSKKTVPSSKSILKDDASRSHEGGRSRSLNKSKSTVGSERISFASDTDESTEPEGSSYAGDEENYDIQLSESCHCYDGDDDVCYCEESDYTPSLSETKSDESKSKSSSSKTKMSSRKARSKEADTTERS